MKRLKKVWVILLIIVVVVVAGYFWQKEKSGQTAVFRTEKVDRGNVVVSISATGTLSALNTIKVGTQVTGTIAKLYADFNDVVKKGQLLAQIDSTFLKTSVNQQRANLSKAQAEVNEAQRNYDRTVQLAAKSLVAQTDLDAATTTLESAKATLMQATASLEQSVVNLQYSTIKAPIDGVVISRDVDLGQTVAASLQAPTIFTIANDLGKMQVQASVDEADIGSVKSGQRVTFRVDAYPDIEFVGNVSQIRLEPVTSSGVVTYSVIINVDNPEQKLLPGMTATVTIETARQDSVYRVPVAALKFTPTTEQLASMASDPPPPNGGDSTGRGMHRHNGANGLQGPEATPGQMPDTTNMKVLWVLENGKLRPMPVRKGIQNSRYVEISGPRLTEGLVVVVGSNGTSTTASSTTSQTQQNPFMPRMPGGGGPPPGGGGRR